MEQKRDHHPGSRPPSRRALPRRPVSHLLQGSTWRNAALSDGRSRARSEGGAGAELTRAATRAPRRSGARRRCIYLARPGSLRAGRGSGIRASPTIVRGGNCSSPASRRVRLDMQRSPLMEPGPMGRVAAFAYLTVCERART
jgi:hypothetical protein